MAERDQGSSSLLSLGLSDTAQIFLKVQQMVQSGKPVICANIGEADFPAPAPVIEATCCALRDGHTRYVRSVGIDALRQAVADRISQTTGISCSLEELAMTSGARQGIFAALYCHFSPGGEVIIPDPQWNSHAEIVRMLGGKVVSIPCTSAADYRFSPQQLA